MKCKFELSELLGIGLTLVVAGIGLSYGIDVIDSSRTDYCSNALEHLSGNKCYVCPNGTYNFWFSDDSICSNATALSGGEADFNATPGIGGDNAFNASVSTSTGVGGIPEKMPTIVTVIVASVIIGILVTYLWGRFQG